MGHRRQRPVSQDAVSGTPISNQRNRNDLRVAVAQAAARLIAEGLTDYQAAKEKAARQLGMNEKQGLPDNHEIEQALREHFHLFARETQSRALSALRDRALRLMRRLEPFSPWLVGAVLAGTANEFSEIELELVGIEAKDFEFYLLNAGVEFELSERQGSPGHATKYEPVSYQVEFDHAPVRITLYEHHAARQAAHPRTSIQYDRVDYAGALKRFEQSGKL